MTRDCPIGPDFGPGENIRQTNYKKTAQDNW